MKPTQKQIELIKTITGIVSSWAGTNDLVSPTHHSDIGEELSKLKHEDNEFADNFNILLTVENCLDIMLSEIRNYYDRENKEA